MAPSASCRGPEAFAFDERQDAGHDIASKYAFNGDLLHLFVDNKGSAVHKWHHYVPIYERYFARFRGEPVRFLEIGVGAGGSLEMWRRYFGADAVIYGIDINPDCRRHDGVAGSVRIGSQTDTAFLDHVVREMGGLDLVLDDGSHMMDHIPVTLRHLFPRLHDGGIYLIEDLHAAYWWEYGGGLRARDNVFNDVLAVIHGMHHWYHGKATRQRSIADCCSGIHVHDSMVVLEKNRVYPPTHSVHG